MDLDGSNNSTVKQEPHNESLPTHPSFHPISEAMNPRESTWHTCCCSAFPVRPWKSTSQRLESSTGIYQCRTAPKKRESSFMALNTYIYIWVYTYSWKTLKLWCRKSKANGFVISFSLWTTPVHGHSSWNSFRDIYISIPMVSPTKFQNLALPARTLSAWGSCLWIATQRQDHTFHMSGLRSRISFCPPWFHEYQIVAPLVWEWDLMKPFT